MIFLLQQQGPDFYVSFPRFQGTLLTCMKFALRCNPQLRNLSTPCCCQWNTAQEAMISYRNCMASFKSINTIYSVPLVQVSFSCWLRCLPLHRVPEYPISSSFLLCLMLCMEPLFHLTLWSVTRISGCVTFHRFQWYTLYSFNKC